MRQHDPSIDANRLIVRVFIAVLSLSVTAVSAESRDRPANLDVEYKDSTTQWVIKEITPRTLPNIKPARPVRITHNLEFDGTLLATAAGTKPNLIPPAQSSTTNDGRKWGDCKTATAEGSISICYAGRGTALFNEQKAELRDFVEQVTPNGLFVVTSEADGHGESGKKIAQKRAEVIAAAIQSAGADADDITIETDTQDHCNTNCRNRVVVKYKPFK